MFRGISLHILPPGDTEPASAGMTRQNAAPALAAATARRIAVRAEIVTCDTS
jgi:hypothetical protein